MSDIIYVDEKEREIIRINDLGHIAVARYPDMEQTIKDFVIETYIEVTSGTEEDKHRLIKFLNYESDENEFCS